MLRRYYYFVLTTIIIILLLSFLPSNQAVYAYSLQENNVDGLVTIGSNADLLPIPIGEGVGQCRGLEVGKPSIYPIACGPVAPLPPEEPCPEGTKRFPGGNCYVPETPECGTKALVDGQCWDMSCDPNIPEFCTRENPTPPGEPPTDDDGPTTDQPPVDDDGPIDQPPVDDDGPIDQPSGADGQAPAPDGQAPAPDGQAPAQPVRWQPTDFGLPENNVVTAPHGEQRVYRNNNFVCTLSPACQPRPGDIVRPHGGIDYSSRNQQGQRVPLPFQAGFPGTVELIPGSPLHTIGIRLDNGFLVQFLHASRIDVRDGEQVNPNTVLGMTGNAGLPGGIIHLHVQVRNPQGNTINPANLPRP
ncbi:MAG: peptidoglycan DD-metalloendopeptidase family protein [Nitrososphaeraceae archaeon]